MGVSLPRPQELFMNRFSRPERVRTTLSFYPFADPS